jgi:hypothetical protein
MFGRPLTRSKAILIPIAALLLEMSCGEQRATAPQSTSSLRQGAAPSLLECPSNETTTDSMVIGPLGGTVSVGATSIAIPSGAIALPTLIRVTVPASRFMEIDVTAADYTSFLFQLPVTVTIDYSRCARSDIDQETLHVWHIDPLTNELLDDMGGQDDKATRRITFFTGHLSGYAVAN